MLIEGKYEYFAFISYKREDEKWAKWLQHNLESYKLPTAIAIKSGLKLPQSLKPVFKDTTDIKPGVLAEVLTQNLEKSKYLIVVCSPRSANSQWVGREISDFISLGKPNNIVLFIVDGKPYSNDPKTECYHLVIQQKLPEMLGVNINEEGKEWKYVKRQKAFIRIVSALLNVSFDSLWQRQKRRIIRNRVLGILTFLLIATAIAGMSVYQYEVNEPFDLHVFLNDKTEHNKNLPFENGKILLCYDKDTLSSKIINSYKDVVSFRNLPGRFLGTQAHLKFDMFGYEPVDTIVKLNTRVMIPISRDSAYSRVQGNVRDGVSDKYLSGILVKIENQQTLTDPDGFFMIKVPLELQKTAYQVTLQRNDYVIKGQIAYPSKNESSIINSLYFK